MKFIVLFLLIFCALLVFLLLVYNPSTSYYSRLTLDPSKISLKKIAAIALGENKDNLTSTNKNGTSRSRSPIGTTTMQSITAEEEEAQIPAILIPANKTLDVRCSRSFYCNPTKCRPILMKEEALARHGYDEISNFLFRHQQQRGSDGHDGHDNKNSNGNSSSNNRLLRIQYWGDSIQASLECDMRQWMHEQASSITASTSSNTATTRRRMMMMMTSKYVQVGCPWNGCIPRGGWKKLASQAQKDVDIIVFTIGSHYESSSINDFQADLDKYYDILEKFINDAKQQHDGLGNTTRRALLILSRSPTNFDAPDGLYKGKLKHRQCVSIPNVPSIIQQQEEALRTFVDRLKKSMTTSLQLPSSPPSAAHAAAIVEHVDVYSLSQSRYQEHRGVFPFSLPQQQTQDDLDCRHYCQNCGILRAWNALIVDKIMQFDPTGTIFQSRVGKNFFFQEHLILLYEVAKANFFSRISKK